MSSVAIVATVVVYLAMLFTVAWLTSRSSSSASFFTGGRNTPRGVAAIAMVGAAMSGVTYISVPGTVASDGFSYLQTTLGFFVGYLIIAFVLIPLYYRTGVVSLYEYLNKRFNLTAQRTGAWLFFVSKLLSASLRAFVICAVLQALIYDRYGLPFGLNAIVMMAMVWLYTRRGGVKAVVWVEMVKTILMVSSIVLCIVFVIKALGFNFNEALTTIANSDYSQILFFDNPLDRRYFWKQFIAGIFLVVAMTGLDQDMMQTMLTCRNQRDSQRSMIQSIVVQVVVITLFLSLGALLYTFIDSRGLSVERGDDLFGYVATECGLPAIVGVAFLLGLVASTYSSAGSALTALTTSFTIDILGINRRYDSTTHEGSEKASRVRRYVHIAIAVMMCGVIMLFGSWRSAGVITLIFTMASYTYGPLLGMFAFGLFTKRSVRKWAMPLVALASPAISYVIATNSKAWFGGYTFSYEILIVNAALSILGLCVFSRKGE
ncbi:MAG: sodium:solute symporter [Alistipes sp.]|nr:sodium:solute symporter [Alistipes sp.]